MFKTEKWKESSYLALNFFRPLANPHMLPVMYLYIIFPMLPPWEMSQKILCATKVTENRNSSWSEFIVQSCRSVTKSCLTLCSPMDCSTPGLPVPHHLLEFAQVHVHWVGDAIQPSHPLWHPSPPALNLSQCQSLFQWVALHIRWPKYWSFSFSISPSSEYSGLISFKIDWFELLAA